MLGATDSIKHYVFSPFSPSLSSPHIPSSSSRKLIHKTHNVHGFMQVYRDREIIHLIIHLFIHYFIKSQKFSISL